MKSCCGNSIYRYPGKKVYMVTVLKIHVNIGMVNMENIKVRLLFIEVFMETFISGESIRFRQKATLFLINSRYKK